MIKVEEIAEKYKGYEVDEEKLKEFLTGLLIVMAMFIMKLGKMM